MSRREVAEEIAGERYRRGSSLGTTIYDTRQDDDPTQQPRVIVVNGASAGSNRALARTITDLLNERDDTMASLNYTMAQLEEARSTIRLMTEAGNEMDRCLVCRCDKEASNLTGHTGECDRAAADAWRALLPSHRQVEFPP